MGTIKNNRISKVELPKEDMDIIKWRRIIKANFPDLLFPAEVGLSVIAQLLINDITNPFSLVLMDVPSAGKTITVNFFSGIKELTYASDKFTPASFVSNASNVKKKELKNIDLLPRIKNKMLLIRDFATLFAKRDEDLKECLGVLTRVLDGEGLSTDSGTHGRRECCGDYLFMILAASTPVPSRVFKVMGNLGSRLFFLNINSREKTKNELVEQLKSRSPREKEKICREATKNFLYTLWSEHSNGVNWTQDKSNDEQLDIIVLCAELLAKLRGVINTSDNKARYTEPLVERPDRINQLFYNICRGHAISCGRDKITNDDLKIIIELTIDSAPRTRGKLIKKLINNNGQLTTSEVERVLGHSKPIAFKEITTLINLGICYIDKTKQGKTGRPEKVLILKDDFKWFISDECKKILTNITSD